MLAAVTAARHHLRRSTADAATDVGLSWSIGEDASPPRAPGCQRKSAVATQWPVVVEIAVGRWVKHRQAVFVLEPLCQALMTA